MIRCNMYDFSFVLSNTALFFDDWCACAKLVGPSGGWQWHDNVELFGLTSAVHRCQYLQLTLYFTT